MTASSRVSGTFEFPCHKHHLFYKDWNLSSFFSGIHCMSRAPLLTFPVANGLTSTWEFLGCIGSKQISHALKTNYDTWAEKAYKQVSGTTLGTYVSMCFIRIMPAQSFSPRFTFLQNGYNNTERSSLLIITQRLLGHHWLLGLDRYP